MRYYLRDLSVDTERRTVSRDGAALKLPDLSFDVLVALITAAPEPVSAVEFASVVWRTKHVSDETVAQRITLLRKALSDDPRRPVYIRTVRGAGYAVLCPVESCAEVRMPWRDSLLRQPRVAAAAGVATCAVVMAALFGLPRSASDVSPQNAALQAPAVVATLVERARAQLRLHQSTETDRAIAILNEALRQAPQHFGARLALSFALTTRSTKFAGKEADKLVAERIARSLIAERPKNSSVWSALGYALDAQGRANEALSAYQTAYRLDPDNAAALSSAAYVLMTQGNLYQALELEMRARRSSNTSRYSEIQIASLLELIDHPVAETWRIRALSLNPGQVVVLSELARSCLRRGELQAALDVLDQTKGEDQFAPTILQLRGRIAVSRGEYARARAYFESAGERGEFELAALTAMLGDGADVEQALRHKLSELENSTWPEFRIYLAEIRASLGQQDEALQLVKQAINLGWRDLQWLKRSPFLGSVMQSNEGRQIEARIKRELDAQRRLMLNAAELAPAFDS